LGWAPLMKRPGRMPEPCWQNTKIKDLYEHPLLVDDLQKLIWKSTDQAQYDKVNDWTMGQLKDFLLTSPRPK